MSHADQHDQEMVGEEGWRRFLPAAAASLSMAAVFVAILGVLLSASANIGLSNEETVGWIMAGYGIPGVFALILTWRHRIPLLVTGNAFIVFFIAGLGSEFSWPELIGASMLGGVIILVTIPLGLTAHIAKLLPAPIVFGLLAGAVLPFVIAMFGELGNETLIVGGSIVVYLVAKVLWEPRVPPILPAMAAGTVLSVVAGGVQATIPESVVFLPAITTPEFSLGSILTVAPVILVLITVQANVPSIVFLRDQGFEPPEGVLTSLSGMGTIGASLLGAVGVSLSLPATAYLAGPDAGPRPRRYWACLVAAIFLILFGALAGYATLIRDILPASFLTVVAGLALLGVVSDALKKVTAGPLVWGPLFAFAITLSDIELLGLGEFFWAIAVGVGVSFIVEREGWRTLHMEAEA